MDIHGYKGGNDAFVDEFFVLPQHRSQGYGTRLLQFAVSKAAQLNVCALHLEVDRDNARAQRLYTSLGFRPRDRYFLMTFR